MKTQISLYCLNCQSATIKRNGQKTSKKQYYFCKDCGRQFIGNQALSYKGCHSELNQKILLMLVRGVGIRDVAEIEKVSISKVLWVLVCFKHKIKPKQKHYDSLEVDEFWIYVADKQHKVWLIYAYHRATGEIVASVWWKRNLKTAKCLRKKVKTLDVRFDCNCSDSWESFLVAFKEDNWVVGKKQTGQPHQNLI